MSRTTAAPAPDASALPPLLPPASVHRVRERASIRVLRDALGARLVRAELRAGQVFLRQGERHERIAFVDRGRVELSAVSESGRECVLEVVRAGETFGEWALSGSASPFAAVAAGESVLLGASTADVDAVVRSDPQVARILIEVACARALRLAERLRDAMVLDAPE